MCVYIERMYYYAPSIANLGNIDVFCLAVHTHAGQHLMSCPVHVHTLSIGLCKVTVGNIYSRIMVMTREFR